MRSWHDYQIIGYSVDGTKREITFNITWPYETDTDIRRADVIFSNVEGYFFEHDLGGNILYSIAEGPLEAFLAQSATRFEQEKKWGWPLFWRGDVIKTMEYLSAKTIKYFDISSSYGMSGWVLASKVEHHETPD
jgi:hypothetical protein